MSQSVTRGMHGLLWCGCVLALPVYGEPSRPEVGAVVQAASEAVTARSRDRATGLLTEPAIEWLRAATSGYVVVDRNRNGHIDIDDGAATLASVLASIQGDVNQDGVVTDADLEIVLGKLDLRAPFGDSADVNLDGVVDQADLSIVFDAIGTEVVVVPTEVLVTVINLLAPSDHSEFFSSMYPGWSPGDPAPSIPNHDPAISRQWPATHQKPSSSEAWPPNHYQSISQSWLPPVPSHTYQVSVLQWPPNHDSQAS